jgi:hypothetical protein
MTQPLSLVTLAHIVLQLSVVRPHLSPLQVAIRDVSVVGLSITIQKTLRGAVMPTTEVLQQ